MARKREFRLSASFWEATRIAVDSLRKNKLRSFLTLLGIILATTTLIAVTALIHGMDVYIAEKVSNMGSDGFRVVRMAWFGPWDPKKFFEMDKRNPQLKPDEFAFLKEQAKLIKEVGMMASRNARVTYKANSQEQVNIQGVTDNIPAINNIQVDTGRGITYEEVRRHAAVAFVGNDIRDQLFPGVDPIGKFVSVEGNPYQVVGVAKTLGSVFGQSQDNFVMIPIESYFKTYGSRNGLRLVAKAIDQAHLNEAEDEARVLMRAYRHLMPGQDDNFSIFASDTIVSLWESLTKTIAGMAVGIVSVFMVVGGIVIMNIMLAVVTERTHEIGIRKSLGARRRDILNQYMVESAVLSGTGGLIGVAVAWCVAIIVRSFTSVPMALPWSSVFIGVGLSATVGLFFGIYPARQASKLDPIEALKGGEITMTKLAFVNGISLAWQTIRSHKLRALLTVLGVIIGTGTIIGVAAILTGFDASVASVLRSFGPNSIIVFKFPVGPRTKGLSPEERTRKDLTYQNAVEIRDRCKSVEDVSSMLFPHGGPFNVHFKGNIMYDVNLFGVEEAYARGGQVDLHLGRFFTDEENRRRRPVVVIGADLEKGLFANVDPVGKNITVDGHEFEVIGTMLKPAASFFGDTDNRVLLPYWTLQRMYPNSRENAIVVTAKDGKLPQALDEVRTVLRIDRRVPYSKPDNFALSTAEQMVSDFRQITAMTFLVMAVLSSIGLLVGGIGVMNIMLVSVTERTHEIGIRKAIGARKADILIQFLIEAAALTGMGGIAGIIFGWLISVISRLVFTSIPATVPLWAAVTGIVVSVAVGLFFGIWPANKAARLDPVVALRYE